MRLSRLLFACALTTSILPSGLRAAEKSVDPKALELLQQTCNTLAGAKAFSYRASNIVEVPAETGQFLTLFSTSKVSVQRPNKLVAQMRGEAPAYDFYYDGSTVAAFAPGTNVYSQTKAPSTIDEMLPDLEDETGIRFATTPLLVSQPYRALTRGLTSGVIIGRASVNGVDCHHLAFRAPGVNWEIWIEANAQALPRRLAVTFTDRTNYPRTIIDFSRWNLHPWLSPSQFTFRPPAGAKEISFLSVRKSSGR